MPCNSEYLRPTGREEGLREAAELLVYALKETGGAIPQRLMDTAASIYGTGYDAVPELCALLRSMPAAEADRVIYNARNRDARRLATWWEDHQAADAERERKDEQKRLSTDFGSDT